MQKLNIFQSHCKLFSHCRRRCSDGNAGSGVQLATASELEDTTAGVTDESRDCDINNAAASDQTAGEEGSTANTEDIQDTASHPLKQHKKSDIVSPTHSILSNSRSSESCLVRNKSLKRVSFDEQPEIIGEHCDNKEKLKAKSSIEEEVFEAQTSSEGVKTVKERAPTPPLIMAGAEETIEIPTDNVEGGEPLIPKKERKPHIKGITFREFDVSSK